jgi:SAM-dependent methyltransferase
MDYLASNEVYWAKGYDAPWPDHNVFRFFGRIVRPDYPHLIGGKLIDFGCGQGSAVNYLHMNGMDAVGVDISSKDIAIAKIRYPHLADRFSVCASDPNKIAAYGFDKGVSIVTALQSLYYFNDDDFAVGIRKLYDSLVPGGLFYATMMGEQSREFFDNSTADNGGLRRVEFKNKRINVEGYYMSFIKDEEHLRHKFSMFEPRHIGFYAAKFRNDEGDGFHYTFCGTKPV